MCREGQLGRPSPDGRVPVAVGAGPPGTQHFRYALRKPSLLYNYFWRKILTVWREKECVYSFVCIPAAGRDARPGARGARVLQGRTPGPDRLRPWRKGGSRASPQREAAQGPEASATPCCLPLRAGSRRGSPKPLCSWILPVAHPEAQPHSLAPCGEGGEASQHTPECEKGSSSIFHDPRPTTACHNLLLCPTQVHGDAKTKDKKTVRVQQREGCARFQDPTRARAPGTGRQ